MRILFYIRSMFRVRPSPDEQVLSLADALELLHSGLALEDVIKQVPSGDVETLEPLLKMSQVLSFAASETVSESAFEDNLRARFLHKGKSQLTPVARPIQIKLALVSTLAVAAAAILALVVLVPFATDSSTEADVRDQLEQVQARIDTFTDKQAGGELSGQHFEELEKDLDKLVETMKDQLLTEVEQARVRSLAEQSVKAVSKVLDSDEEVSEAVEAVIERAGAVVAAVTSASEDEQGGGSSSEGDGSNSVGADGGGVTTMEED